MNHSAIQVDSIGMKKEVNSEFHNNNKIYPHPPKIKLRQTIGEKQWRGYRN